MYRDYKVRLKMSMFRPIKQEDYIDVYESPYAMITYVALRIMGKDDMYIDAQPYLIDAEIKIQEKTKSAKQVENYSKNENNNTNISKRKDIVFR